MRCPGGYNFSYIRALGESIEEMGSLDVAQPEHKDYALQARSLVKRYGNSEMPALDNFDLDVQQGEFFGLLGRNGAGKTTAVSIFSGLFPPDSGSVSILGVDNRMEPTRVKQSLGFVPQDISLYERLTARENLLFFGKLYGLEKGALQDRVEQCLEFARLEQQSTNLVATFSGGMKRRLNLAVGLVHEPRFLLLDEPTVGVDTQSRHLIHQQLLELNHHGTTIFYTSHYLEEVEMLCSRIGVIDNGRIIVQGAPKELLQQSKHRNLEDFFLHLTGKQLRDG